MSANTATEIDALSAIFSALSDPTRRAMLARLSQGEASVNELAAPFKMSLPAVSKHIKVLEKETYIEVRKQFVARKPQTTYQATLLGRKAFGDHLTALENLLKNLS